VETPKKPVSEKVYQAVSNSLLTRWQDAYNGAVMRIFSGSLLAMAAGLVLAPSSQDFHNRYGESDLERFSARPGIILTVEYGSDHLACQVLISPPQSLIHQENQAPLMSSEGGSEVLEEIVPVAVRGKEINSFIFESGCNEARTTDYDNGYIMRSKHTCDHSSQAQDVRTTISFKRNICPKQANPTHPDSLQ
jgi:hypothetical protein